MLKRFWERRRDEEGFTLIELMVVVLIIGILIAIALPTFLGARKRAQDRAAQSSLRNAVAAAKVLYTDCDKYTTGATCATALAAADFTGVEPSLTWTVSPSTAPKEVAWTVSNVTGTDAQVWAGASMSDSGTCFWIRTNEASSATVTAGTFYGSTATAANCTGAAALAAANAKF